MSDRTTNKISSSVCAVFGMVLFGVAIGLGAAPGRLDPTFSGDGRLTDWPGARFARGVAIQPDGKIVIVGSYRFAPEQRDFRIARYNPDGSPDLSFGGGAGRVTTDFGGNDDSQRVAIQPDGKILVVGVSEENTLTHGSVALARYNQDGSLDTSFGDGSGKVLTLAPCWYAFYGAGSDIALRPDGKIVAALGLGTDENCDTEGLLLRYNSNGILDASFGRGGLVTTRYGLWSVALQPADGKIVTGRFDRIFRFNSNGSRDTTFGSSGMAMLPEGYSSSGRAVALDHSGKIVAAGHRYRGDSIFDFVLLRFNANGSLDTSFDSDGMVEILNFGLASSVVIQSGGKIVAAGETTIQPSHDIALVRYTPDGSLDPSFGDGDGIVRTGFDDSSSDSVDGMTLDTQGRAVVIGGCAGMFAIARFELAPRTTQFDFDGDDRSDVSVFRPADRTWYLNRSTAGLSVIQFGLSTDNVTPADFDGDGKTDVSVYRGGTWYWLKSSDHSFNAVQFGISSDIPVPADYTGDGQAEIAVYRSGTWWTLNLATAEAGAVQFGLATDKPVSADYDGDGRTDQGIYRANGEWHLNRSTEGYAVINFGLATDVPVVGDYDGDGRADEAVYRNGTWYVNQSAEGFVQFQFGIASDIPAPADYDGDGRTDVTVFRDGVWYLLQSAAGLEIKQFGSASDRPLPSAYLP